MYKGVFRIFSRYWQAYGGLGALVRSVYLHAALLVLLPVTFHTWSEPLWWNDVLSALPNLLGFSLAGFAIFIGFGDERFRTLLAEPEENPTRPTIYVSLCATFVHFILVQIIALIYAVIAKSWWFYATWMEPVRELLPWMNSIAGGVGYALFLYALTSVLAATMHVFRITSMYEAYQHSTFTPSQHYASNAIKNVVGKLNEPSDEENAELDMLSLVYLQSVGLSASRTEMDVFIVRAFKAMLPEDLTVKLRKFTTTHPSIAGSIRDKRDRMGLFRSPSILLTYYMAQTQPEKTKEVWPLTPAELEPVYTDLGKRF